MLELATHIVETKKAHFEPEKFEDQYEDALKELLKKKQSGEKIEAPKERALRQGHQSHGRAAAKRGERARRRRGAQAGAGRRPPRDEESRPLLGPAEAGKLERVPWGRRTAAAHSVRSLPQGGGGDRVCGLR